MYRERHAILHQKPREVNGSTARSTNSEPPETSEQLVAMQSSEEIRRLLAICSKLEKN